MKLSLLPLLATLPIVMKPYVTENLPGIEGASRSEMTEAMARCDFADLI